MLYCLKYFDNLKIRSKLLVGYGLIIAFFLMFALASAVWVKRIGQALDYIIDKVAHTLVGVAGKTQAAHQDVIFVPTETSGDTLRLSVVDDGCGLPAQNLPLIFEPLFTTPGFGVGVDPSSVKEVVVIHGGSVTVTSVLHKRTISLPQRSAGEILLFDEKADPSIQRKAA